MCDYSGNDFGANYDDACCIDGYLWDLDSCDEPGGSLSNGGDIPCPKCNHAEWLAYVEDDVVNDGYNAFQGKKSEGDCPKSRFPEDQERFREWWLRGFNEAKTAAQVAA